MNIPSLFPLFVFNIVPKNQSKLLITNKLDKISLHTRALEPDQKALNKAQLLSFKEADKNYLVKKLKNIEIAINKK